MATDAVITFNYATDGYCIAIYKKADCFLDRFIPDVINKSLIKSNTDSHYKGRHNWQNIVLETVYDIVNNEHRESGKIGNIKIVGDLSTDDFRSFIWKVDITPIAKKYSDGNIPN